MTWLWAIFSSFLLAFPAAAAVVSGTVRLVDSQVRDVHKKADYSGVVLWLDPATGRAQIPNEGAGAAAVMLQRDKEFSPHVLAVTVGSAVEFPNRDPIFHNAFSTFDGQVFDVGLYPPGNSRTVKFNRPGIVRVFCNIHPNMSAIIVVLDTPWFAVSQRSGVLKIEGVPRGDYQLRVFHERATPETLRSLERKISVTEGAVSLPSIVISETGFVATPHKNKYGTDYPPSADESIFYPGGHK
jgi:plastocyanin